MSYDIRFTATPWRATSLDTPGMILRIIQHLTAADGSQIFGYLDETNDGSHLPMVKSVRDLESRINSLDEAEAKYRTKSTEIMTNLRDDLVANPGDAEANELAEDVINSNRVLQDYLEGLQALIVRQRQATKRLSDYLTPPTVELFHKKANRLLQAAPAQEVSMLKKNRCTICMDATADCLIVRTCEKRSSPSSSSTSTATTSAPFASTVPTTSTSTSVSGSGSIFEPIEVLDLNEEPPSLGSRHSSSARHLAHCEQDQCKCGPTMCKGCLLTHYWTSTHKGSKSFSRCVCCRAEFCLKDVYPVNYVEDDAYLRSLSSSPLSLKPSPLPVNTLHANNTITTTTTTSSSSTTTTTLSTNISTSSLRKRRRHTSIEAPPPPTGSESPAPPPRKRSHRD